MATENCQKIKLLKLMELLQQETDELHPMRTGTICERLRKMNISCDRRTLHKDIKLLNAQGYEVMAELVGHELAYYIADRSFSVPELKVMIDAVQAAGFITEKKTDELIDKIAALSGSHRAEILKGNIVEFNTRKHSNEVIYYSVDSIEKAILEKKKINFCYFDLDENGNRKYRREGHHYVVEPVSLVLLEDNYYLVVYSSHHANTATYRVDRMDGVEVIDDDISEKAITLREEVSALTTSSFKMFGGELKTVTIQFDDSLLDAVYDKFGETITVSRVDDRTVITSVGVQISPPFWGWVFQFYGKLKVIAPELEAQKFTEVFSALATNH